MTLLFHLGLLPALLGLAGEAPRGIAPRGIAPKGLPAVRRVVIQDEVILRVPIRPRPAPAIEWKERKGPKCLESRSISGAMLSGQSSIDFVLRDRSRVRAEMDNQCPALDFYNGFYFQLTDERICAKREMVRRRDGGSCRIERFRALEPKVKK